MLRNQLYYEVKPFLPASLRHWVRRWMARRKRGRVGKTWPILPGSERRPEGWPGWPGGKKFAFVLTHDVEGLRGLKRSPKLAAMDQALGFRSSFNFVPEGEYRVPDDLRAFLTQEKFEVGVHDLHHNGSLYRSHGIFRAQAKKINQYLRSWDA